MADSTTDPAQIQRWLERIRAGDKTARDEMMENVYGRLENLAHRMLRRFPNVRSLAQTDDVLHNAVIRLLRALDELEPDSVKDFFGLAAAQMRWVLLDLARQVRARRDVGASYNSFPTDEDSSAPGYEPPAESLDTEGMERWCKFHEMVEQLPAEEREVVGLIFYHGWPQAAVADLFQISERTVRRRWTTAMQKLQHLFKE